MWLIYSRWSVHSEVTMMSRPLECSNELLFMGITHKQTGKSRWTSWNGHGIHLVCTNICTNSRTQGKRKSSATWKNSVVLTASLTLLLPSRTAAWGREMMDCTILQVVEIVPSALVSHILEWIIHTWVCNDVVSWYCSCIFRKSGRFLLHGSIN